MPNYMKCCQYSTALSTNYRPTRRSSLTMQFTALVFISHTCLPRTGSSLKITDNHFKMHRHAVGLTSENWNRH